MTLYITCSSCHKDINLHKKAKTKFEFERHFGSLIEIGCSFCGASNTRHVNRTFAKPGLYTLGLGVAISLGISSILSFFMGGISFVCIAAPGIFYLGQQKSINAYNRGMIPRK